VYPISMAEPAPSLPQEPRPYTPEEITKLKERVEHALDKIRPAIQMDGGDADLIDVTPEGVAVVQLRGHCETCSLSPMTMKLGVERLILEDVPEIRAVEQM
jgi:Fe-S cluster biogenesis protein NfuA